MARYTVDINSDGFSRQLSEHDNLQAAIAAAPRSGQPVQTGTHEWAFLPERTKKLVLIHLHW